MEGPNIFVGAGIGYVMIFARALRTKLVVCRLCQTSSLGQVAARQGCQVTAVHSVRILRQQTPGIVALHQSGFT